MLNFNPRPKAGSSPYTDTKEFRDTMWAKMTLGEQCSYIEIRTQMFGCDTKVVVYSSGFHKDGTSTTKSAMGKNKYYSDYSVFMSSNGPMQVDCVSLNVLNTAISEAIRKLHKALYA